MIDLGPEILTVFVEPMFASLLTFLVMRKAGLGGWVRALASGPLVALILTIGLILSGVMTSIEAFVLTLPIGFAPLLALAFKDWPQAGGIA
ncbi:MAG: hypothetical protein R3D97_17055 [Paracoccaceae bacterium]